MGIQGSSNFNFINEKQVNDFISNINNHRKEIRKEDTNALIDKAELVLINLMAEKNQTTSDSDRLDAVKKLRNGVINLKKDAPAAEPRLKTIENLATQYIKAKTRL